MVFYPSNENPTDVQIVSQGVDTLVTSHVSVNEKDYNDKFLPFTRYLEELKEKAQMVEGINQNTRYIKSDLVGLGEFKVYAQSNGSYRYKIENNDLLIFIGNHKFGANDFLTPQIKVEYRAHYLFALSYRKAYYLVLKLIQKVLGESKNKLDRIDLYTDVQGIAYTSFDELRFQTNYKCTDFKVNKYQKFKKVTGFHFGNGDFLFRVYDKTNEIKQKINKSFIKYKWIVNGYDIRDTLPVWRHEIQYRRPELKQFMPKDCEDEVLFNFTILSSLWHNATQKVRWENLTNDEIYRISETGLKSDSIKKIFQRARKDNRYHFWTLLSTWDNKLCKQGSKYKYVKESQDKTAKKFLKAFIGATYRSRSNDPLEVVNMLEEVQQEVRDMLGITLHEYGELKIVSNFVENAKIMLNDGLNVSYDYSADAFKIYSKLSRSIKDIDKHPDMKRAYKIFQTDKKRAKQLTKLEEELLGGLNAS